MLRRVEHHPFDDVTLESLRRRTSAKWSHYAEDVLPAWVAEMDYPLADPIAEALRRAVDDGDTGYAHPRGLGGSFLAWSHARWGLRLASQDVRLVPDVVTGIAEILLVATRPGDAVVIDTPVYHPFAATIERTGRVVAEAPVLRTVSGGFALDLDAIERAYAAGARAHLLCSPHNPTGIVYPRATLERLAELADRYDVLVVSDEIHAPLTLPGAVHVPFPSVSALAKKRSVVLTSASKAWNIAGLKAAIMFSASDEAREVLDRIPQEIAFHSGHFGVIASRAAFEAGEPWRESVVKILDRNRRLLGELLAEHLPRVRYVPPEASYLAWLDCSELGLSGDPTRIFLERGKVALSAGPMFGAPGRGFTRLNLATTRSLLEEAVRRMARAVV